MGYEVIPANWTHYRSWDFHPANINAIVFLSLSPQDECFVWHELNIDPKRNTTEIIAEQIAGVRSDLIYKLSRIDPLAAQNQSNTNTSVIDDLNKYFKNFKREGFGHGGVWKPYDTKYHVTQIGFLRGRDHIKQRLINASLAEKPFNNNIVVKGIKKQLPTLWVSKDCKMVLQSLYKWRIEKGKPSQQWSHHCTALEGIMKEKKFRPHVEFEEDIMETRKKKYRERITSNYFKVA